MSFYPARRVFDGNTNVFQNVPIQSITPAIALVAEIPAYDNSAKSSRQVSLASGTPFTWSSVGGTAGAYGIVFVAATNSGMDLTATAAVTWGGVSMTSLGSAYNGNISTGAWGWVFVLNGIPSGAQTISVTLTQAGKTFTGYGSSYSYNNVASVGPLQTAFGTSSANPSVQVAASNATDIVWGAINTNATAATGFSLTPRQSSTVFPLFYAGDTTGSSSVTVSGTSSTIWSAFGLDLQASYGLLGNVTPVLPQTANYTALAGQLVPCNATSAPFTVTLPTAPIDGANIVIKKTDASTNSVTYTCGGSDRINVASGVTSATLILQWQAVRLQYSAVSSLWYVISTDEPLGQLDARYLGITGNAATATKLASPANINGVPFDGSGAVTVADSTKVPNLVPTALKTSAYTAAVNDLVLVNGGNTVTLPTAPADKSRVAVKKMDASGTTVTIAAGGSDVFNVAGGSTTLTMVLQYQANVLQYNASAGVWYVVSTDAPLGGLDTRYLNQSTTGTAAGITGKTTPTGALVGTTDAQTLTNKTLTTPAISSPTGLVKADVGLGNVDNTSDASKTATLDARFEPLEQFARLASAYTLTSTTSAQQLFNTTTNGALTMPVGDYFFECGFAITGMSATSGSYGFGFGGTATIAQSWSALSEKAVNITSTGGAAVIAWSTINSTALQAANTNTAGVALIKGTVNVTGAGTLIPQVSLTVAAAAIIGAGSYFRIQSVNSSAAFSGAWS